MNDVAVHVEGYYQLVTGQARYKSNFMEIELVIEELLSSEGEPLYSATHTRLTVTQLIEGGRRRGL